MDGSTDSGNIGDELFLAVFCDIDGMDERVHTRMMFLAVLRLGCSNACNVVFIKLVLRPLMQVSARG